ncbi:MAG: YggS family pyridoxal phosphate-dependent enzyme [Alphaproteobacteria bacterium]|nr:YggS family pyridoxal phosphate-dependent enzyme [Alphaproteobacteria bacterium]MBV9693432.1 YggS family pyridoxal phosphate-dependent enzyme [Alphaproteobacteria bacterium]
MSLEAENLAHILARIEAARKAAIRPAASTTLVAVSKTHGPERVQPLLDAGHRVFGENRVREAHAKWPALKDRFPGIVLHLIGPLQTNKLRDALALFDVIETLDRPRLAEALAQERDRGARLPDLFLQVNTGEEPQKAGVAPLEAPSLIVRARALSLPLKGLMCIPPADADPVPHFALLAKLARDHALPLLSMGMSGDFERAIRFGATHVRVGSAIFGPRLQLSEKKDGLADNERR